MLARTLLPVVFLCAFAAVAAPPVVRNPKPLRVEGRPSVLLTGNFAGDAHPDLLLLDPGNSLQVLPNNGTGPFAAPVVTLTPEATWDATAGDFDGDGISDVFVTVPAEGRILVFRGAADGRFTRAASIATFELPRSLVTGDVDGDGKLDLVVGSNRPHDDDELAVFYGNGTGGFGPGVILPFEGGDALFVCDLNADGKGDIVAGLRGAIVTFLSSGTSFAQSARLVPSGGATQPAIGDFNRDGKWDIVTGSDVFKGNGDGTFTAGSKIPRPLGDAVRAIDADGDGKLDLIGGLLSGGVGLWRGKGDATFATPELYVTDTVSGIGAGDFDRNGTVDVVVLGGYQNSSYDPVPPILALLRGTGGGVLDGNRMFPIRTEPTSIFGAEAINAIAADMNGDGKFDIVVRATRAGDYRAELAVLLNDATGKLLPAIFTDLGESTWAGGPSFAVGDVNGDQNNDVVLISNDAYRWSARTYLGRGDGTFHAPVPFTIAGGNVPTLADFTGDGTLDLMMGGGSTAALYRGAGNGTFESPTSSLMQTEVIADLNGDGRPDAIGSGGYDVLVALNNGSGGFSVSRIAEKEHERFGTVGDFNGDGHLDYLLIDYDGTRVRMGAGDGTFGAPIAFTVSPIDAGPTDARDFDGDGKVDVAIGNSIYLGNGDGTFGSYAKVRTTLGRYSTVADFDGNGSPDLAWIDYEAGRIAIIRTRIGAAPTLTTSLSLGANPSAGEYAQQIKFTATRTEHPLTPATGAFVFKVNGVPVAMHVRNTTSTDFTRAFAGGTYTVEAIYTGDDFYLPSSASTQLTIVRAQTSIQASSRGSRPYNSTFLVSAYRIAPLSPGLPGPTGTLSFREGATTLSPKLTSGGYYEFPASQLAVGTHTITVEYAGDANYEPSSTTFEHVVTKPLPTLYVYIVPSDNVIAGETVTLRATISGGATGTITFVLDQKPLSPRPIIDGVAEMTTTLAWGAHSVTATYDGDANWAGRTSNNGANIDVLIGNWGTPMQIDATAGTGTASVNLRWPRVRGGKTYTVYRKTSHGAPWELIGVFAANTLGTSQGMPMGTTWLFAVTATDENGNTTPMSTPDIATTVMLLPAITTGKRIEGADVTRLRAGINAVRAFAGMQPFAFSGNAAKGAVVRKDHVMEMRGALSEARAAIGLPLGFSDPTLTAKQTPVRAIHLREIRAGID
jgi:hypothetical protein